MSVTRNSLTFALGTLISRVTGLLRESILAWVFGSSKDLDAFLIANRIPNMLRELVAEGALSSSFTKLYSEICHSSEEEAQKFLNDTFWLVATSITCICIVGIVLSPVLVSSLSFFSEGEFSDRYQLTVILTRLLFPFILFMSLGALSAGVLHYNGQFLVSALSPTMLNVGYVAGALLFADFFYYLFPGQGTGHANILGLTVGVLIGGILQTLIQYFFIWKKSLKKVFRFNLPSRSDPRLKKLMKLMVPMVIAGSSGQLNVLINTNFATTLPTGTVSWLNYAFRLFHLPIALFAVSIGTVILPQLTRSIKKNKDKLTEETNGYLQRAVELCFWLITPCFCFFALQSLNIVKLLYLHGQFGQTDLLHTDNILFVYSFGLFGYAFVKVLTSFYYAADKVSFAMKVSLFSIFVNFILNYFLVPHYGYLALAMTTVLVSFVNASFLFAGIFLFNARLKFKRLMLLLLTLATICLLCYGLRELLNFWMQAWALSLHDKTQAFISLVANGIVHVILFASGYLILARFFTPKKTFTVRKVKK